MSHPFVFGKSKNIRGVKQLGKLFRRIASGSQHQRPLYHTNGAKIVLVGSNIASTLTLMGRLIPRLWSEELIEGIIDLSTLTKSPAFNLLVDDLDLRPKSGDRHLACAGNKANYVLRALLLYARFTVEVPAKIITQDVNSMLDLISVIALDGIPDGVETIDTVVRGDDSYGDENSSLAWSSPIGRWRRGGGSRNVEGQGNVPAIEPQKIDRGDFVRKQELWPPAIYDPEEGWDGIMYGKVEETDQENCQGNIMDLQMDDLQDSDEGYLSNDDLPWWKF